MSLDEVLLAWLQSRAKPLGSITELNPADFTLLKLFLRDLGGFPVELTLP